MTTEGEGRAVALQRYKILAGLMGLLSAGLLIIGIIAVSKYPDSGFGPPYFIGCFVVGCLGLIHALVCTFIAFKGGDIDNDDIKKREIGCAMTGHYILSMFLFMGCFIGTILAGIGGLGHSSYFDEKTGYEDKVKTLSGIIIAGCILTLGVNVFGMCIVCTYGSYFGVHIQNRQRGRAVITFGTTGTGTNTAFVTHTGGLQMGGMGANADIQTLQEQNRLLQENLRLQQELFNQQQRAQGNQYGFNPPPPSNYPPGGVYPPPDPSFPSAPPPSYDSVK
ncbi:uncharacterized protein LOC128233564 [Mya arenaria]|uniref:uncharacterized protein LOC128233564 n=1 Tax=Mya arenaria TaxID=6604 RepID=UPI0022E5A532|nr:uncharacterized protein LOC128233564 [Mya arenaria]